jgi:hypothetical protein
MSSRVSGSLSLAITANTVRPVFLVRIVFASDNIVRMATTNHSIDYDAGDGNGSQTYQPAGSLLTVSAVDENSDLGASGLQITLSGCDPLLVQNARDVEYQGGDCDIYLGALNSDGTLIGATPYFSGVNDHMVYSAREGAIDVTLTAENKMIRLSKSRLKRNTDAEQKFEFPTDKGFEFVNYISERDVEWGKY